MVVDKFGRSLPSEHNKFPQRIVTVGYTLTKDGNIDIQRKRICNMSKPTDGYDAVNKLYVDEKFDPLKNEVRQKLFNIGKNLVALEKKLQKIEYDINGGTPEPKPFLIVKPDGTRIVQGTIKSNN